MSVEEKEFLFSHFTKKQKVLEYGSGKSTAEIASKVKKLVTMEHNNEWYERVNESLPKNATIIFAPPPNPCRPPNDGSRKEFKSYIEYPINIAPFDIIFIDGRARVACASICNRLSHKDTIIFIHDWDREEYHKALKYLVWMDQVGTMAKFMTHENWSKINV